MYQPMPATHLPLHVTLDVGAAVHQNAGLSRYTEHLAAHLLANHADQIALTLFYNAHSGDQLPVSLRAAAPIGKVRTIQRGQYAWRLGVLASQWLHLPLYQRAIAARQTSANTPQLYHAAEHLLPYLRGPTVLTVHDLIFERYPEHHTAKNRFFLKLAMPRFVQAATTIIAVSQQTKRDLIELYGTPAAKIQVIYEGIDPEFAPPSRDQIERVRRQYSPGAEANSARPYLLMVGTLEPRKNHATALRALAQLKAAGFAQRLLLVGGQGWLFAPVTTLIEQLGLSDDVIFAGYVPAADLPALYAGADCLLQPSLYEGFGFPVLEAMACRTPVICSNTSSLPEVAGDAALLVAPSDAAELATAIRRLLTEPGLADALCEKGVTQAAKFRWAKCAQETVAVYRQTALKKRNG